jgi:hypothetical protein
VAYRTVLSHPRVALSLDLRTALAHDRSGDAAPMLQLPVRRVDDRVDFLYRQVTPDDLQTLAGREPVFFQYLVHNASG